MFWYQTSQSLKLFSPKRWAQDKNVVLQKLDKHFTWVQLSDSGPVLEEFTNYSAVFCSQLQQQQLKLMGIVVFRAV